MNHEIVYKAAPGFARVFQIYLEYTKLDGVASMIEDPLPANSTTMHSRVVCLNINLCHLIYLVRQKRCNF